MKILNLIQCLNLGGMEQSAYILMDKTQNISINWQVQSVTSMGEGKEFIDRLNIPVEDCSYIGKFGWKSHLELKAKIRSFQGDIVLITGPTLTSCLAVKGTSYKKVLGVHFCHGSKFQDICKWKLFYSAFGKDYDLIIYHSQYILEEAKKIAPQIQHKFRLIEYSTQNCIKISEQEKYIARQDIGIPTDAFIIGNAGWLIERKRFDVFLRVCARLISCNKNIYCLIAGDGILRSELEELATNLGITNKVKFIGWQKNLNTFYKSLDLLLFNSNSDAFGRTVMEAMGCGIPVVASVLEGGTDSVLRHQENGYLISVHDIEQLARYCLNLIQDAKLYEKFQSAAIDIINKRFSDKLYIDKYLTAFNEVIE